MQQEEQVTYEICLEDLCLHTSNEMHALQVARNNKSSLISISKITTVVKKTALNLIDMK